VIARCDLDGAAHTEEHAVERAFIADDELAVAIEEVRVLRRDERIVREDELPVAADDVLLGVELVAEPLDPFTADEDQLRLAGSLELAEELRARALDLRRDRRSAAATELVTDGHRRLTRPANEVLGLIHELLH
jgi:hypothetical protein